MPRRSSPSALSDITPGRPTVCRRGWRAPSCLILLGRRCCNGSTDPPHRRVAFCQRADHRSPLVVYCAHDQRLYSDPILEHFTREDRHCQANRVRHDTEATKSLGLVNRLIREKSAPHLRRVLEQPGAGDHRSAGPRPVGSEYKGSGWRADTRTRSRTSDGRWCGFAARLRVWIVNTEKIVPGDRRIGRASVFAARGSFSRMAVAQAVVRHHADALLPAVACRQRPHAEGPMHADTSSSRSDRGSPATRRSRTWSPAARATWDGPTPTTSSSASTTAIPIAMLPIRLPGVRPTDLRAQQRVDRQGQPIGRLPPGGWSISCSERPRPNWRWPARRLDRFPLGAIDDGQSLPTEVRRLRSVGSADGIRPRRTRRILADGLPGVAAERSMRSMSLPRSNVAGPCYGRSPSH